MRRIYILALTIFLLASLVAATAAACTGSKLAAEFYTYPRGDSEFAKEAQKQGDTVWQKVKGLSEVKYVTSHGAYTVLTLLHPYSVGIFDPATAEWITIVSSAPDSKGETRIAVVRLDYQTFTLKKAYQATYPPLPDAIISGNSSYAIAPELSLDDAVKLMEQTMKEKDPYAGGRQVDKAQVESLGGNYVYTYPASDFGGTIVVNKYAGKVVFYATTVWDGAGKLIAPQD